MLEFHMNKKKESSNFTILGTNTTESQSKNYGCMVADRETHEVLHYVEKPETYVSSLINAGIYLFNYHLFDFIKELLADKPEQNSDFK